MDSELIKFLKKETLLGFQHFAVLGANFWKLSSVNKFNYSEIYEFLDDSLVLCKGFYKQCQFYYDEALQWYQKCQSKLDREYMIACLDFHFQNYERVIEICQKYSHYFDFKIMLMSLYNHQGEYEKCLELGIDDNLDVRRKYACALLGLKKYDEVSGIINENLHHGDFISYITLGVINMELKNPELAVSNYQKALEHGVNVGSYKIVDFYGIDQREKAIILAEKHYEETGDVVSYIQMHTYKETTDLEILKKMANVGNLSSIIFYANKLILLNKYFESLEYYHRLLRYGINTLLLYTLISDCYFGLGDQETGHTYLIEAIKHYDEKLDNTFFLKNVYFKMMMIDGSPEKIQRFLKVFEYLVKIKKYSLENYDSISALTTKGTIQPFLNI